MASTSDEVDAKEQFNVLPPFDQNSSGDCILRASDDAEFKVYRNILMLASSVFADMFSIPQPSTAAVDDSCGKGDEQETVGGLPVVDVSEGSQTIDFLLRCIYPGVNPTITTLDLAFNLMLAVEKYDIPPSTLPLETFLSSKEVLKMDPIRAYCIAWRLGNKNAAMTASQYTHSVTLSAKRIKQQVMEIAGGPEALLALHELRERRDAALGSTLGCITSYSCLCQACNYMNQVPLQYSDAFRLRNVLKQALEDPEPPSHDICAFLKLGSLSRKCPRCPYSQSSDANPITVPEWQALTFWERVRNFPKTISWPSE